jgi:hypothetical protein
MYWLLKCCSDVGCALACEAESHTLRTMPLLDHDVVQFLRQAGIDFERVRKLLDIWILGA